jgi:hypothetical protein
MALGQVVGGLMMCCPAARRPEIRMLFELSQRRAVRSAYALMR